MSAPSQQNVGTRLPFRPLGDALRATPTVPDWLVDGLIGRQLLTVLAGRPKVGKSTLLFWMLSRLAQGLPFLGRQTTTARALLLTEERDVTLQEKRLLFGLGHDDLHVLMRHEAVGTGWVQTVREATDYCREQELALLVVDAVDKWFVSRSDNESENSASDTLQNVAPLMAAAGDGLSVLAIAHQSKQKGQYGEALRGSNALAGAMDIILELERGDAHGERVLNGTSRLRGTPERLAFSWGTNTNSNEGGHW